jgi:hypothetical protein
VSLAFMLAACGTEPLPEPARVVDELLTTRSSGSTDPADYARYLESTAVAEALAEDAATRTETLPPTPEWERPVVASQTTDAAQVDVRWRLTSDFPDWLEVTRFVLKRSDDTWLIVDAADPSQSEEQTETP